jgi:hypothetical protein
MFRRKRRAFSRRVETANNGGGLTVITTTNGTFGT